MSLRTTNLEAMGGGAQILLVSQRSHTSMSGGAEGKLVGVDRLSNLLYYNMLCLKIKGFKQKLYPTLFYKQQQ